jgi:sulfite reductase (NADPH) flavoprotein alpha-component
MIRTLWRYSHLTLAVFSFITLTIAAATGIILAVEPVLQQQQPYKAAHAGELTLAQTVPVLKAQYKGIRKLLVDDAGFVRMEYSDGQAGDRKVFVDPLTGKVLGQPAEQPAIFQWATTLHRSLFLHETGRAVMGITAALLVLIALSGILLVAQKQGGFRRFFARVEPGSRAGYYHTVSGRISFLFILAIALSGGYMSASRFLLKPKAAHAKVDVDQIRETPERMTANFPLFQQTRLAAVQSLEFPFSDFPEDYYTLRLHDREVCVNQVTGDILATQLQPRAYLLNAFATRWHTGRSGTVWAILLGIAAAYILFFIYSGFVITWQRLAGRQKNRYRPEESEIILLTGSENGSTLKFAAAVYRQLLQHGRKAYITPLNQYGLYPKATYFIILTSTYGLGEPPANAANFASLLVQYPQQQPVQFSVVGFGSRAYEHFCGFAFTVHELLLQQPWAQPLMEVVTVNDRSPQDFSHWLTQWTALTGQPLLMPRALLKKPVKGLRRFTVTAKSATDDNHTFIIDLAGPANFLSGDLLAIYPKNDHRERLYSIGRVNNQARLSVKLHPHGLGSAFLHGLQPGDALQARIIRNPHFHFPTQASQVILIANGTGIAPFIGMIACNTKKITTDLYCGFRYRTSFSHYAGHLQTYAGSQQLRQVYTAFSKEDNCCYVTDLVTQNMAAICEALEAGAVIMICGSLAMQQDVLLVLGKAISTKDGTTLATYLQNGQIRSDCY